MSEDHTLNLSEIDPPIWRVLSGKVAYGPYTLGQLQRLIDDRQLSRTSKLAEGDNSPFLPAADHPAIMRLLLNQAPLMAQQPEPEAEPSGRFMLVFYGDDESRERLLDTLNETGEFAELVFGTFVLKAELSIAELQRTLSAICARDDCFVLSESDTGRLAWYGIADEISEHVRLLWKG